jgi:hypothetical protein
LTLIGFFVSLMDALYIRTDSFNKMGVHYGCRGTI